jgi:hypothetical protein
VKTRVDEREWLPGGRHMDNKLDLTAHYHKLYFLLNYENIEVKNHTWSSFLFDEIGEIGDNSFLTFVENWP